MFDKRSLKENGLMLAIHIILYVVGYYLVRFFGSDSSEAAILFIVIFIAVKLGYFFYFSNKKNLNEKIVNFLVISSLGTIEFFIYLIIILSFLQLSNWSFNTFNHFLIFFLFIISVICIPLFEKHTMKNMKMENIWPFITVAFFEILFSILLIFVDTKESAIISAFSALLILLLTPENSKFLFNVKVSKYREQQISLIRFLIIFLLPIIYTISRIIPISGCNWQLNDIVIHVIYRLVLLIFIISISIFFIYFKKVRLFIQEFLGLSSKQAELNGNWNLIINNVLTDRDIIVSKFVLNIDGQRIKHDNIIYYFNKNFEILNDSEEKIGKIIIINSDKIILEIETQEESASNNKNMKSIKLIKRSQEEYNKFNVDYQKKDGIFIKFKILDPITQDYLDETILFKPKDKNYYLEITRQTNYKYELKDGHFVLLEGDEENSLNINFDDFYESDTY